MSERGARSGSAGGSATVPHTRLEDDKQIEEYYTIGHKLGQGTFGVVREVTHKKTAELLACKTINKEKAGGSAIKLLEREVAILKSVHHEHVIKLYEVYESAKKMYLVMEYCGNGELADVLNSHKSFSEEKSKLIMMRLASAISYLHKNGMVHRDLKLENILVGKNPTDSHDDMFIKVTDFGLSVVKGGTGHDNMLMEYCGTPVYMAPEVLENKTYGEKCDVWSMGVIAYMLLAGSPPFQGREEQKLMDTIQHTDLSKVFEQVVVWRNVSAECKHCIRGMLTIDPAYRLTAREVLDHPWITGKSLSLHTARPRNVLEMMKEWRLEEDMRHRGEELEEAGVDSVVNGSVEVNNNGQGTSKSEKNSVSSMGSKGKSPDHVKADSRKKTSGTSVRNSSHLRGSNLNAQAPGQRNAKSPGRHSPSGRGGQEQNSSAGASGSTAPTMTSSKANHRAERSYRNAPPAPRKTKLESTKR